MDTKISKILLCSDLSENSRPAFLRAASIALKFDASLVILHVLEGTAPVTERTLANMIGVDKLEEIKKKNTETAKGLLVGKATDRAVLGDSLDAFCEMAVQNRPECTVPRNTIVIGEGIVAEEILRQAQEQKCDMIVMGHVVRNRVAEAVMGSVARDVVRHAKVPVLLVPIAAKD